MPRIKRSPKPAKGPPPRWHDYSAGARSEIYTAEFLERLLHQFKIPNAQAPQLKRLLESWADVYRVDAVQIDQLPRTGFIKRELKSIRTHVDRLQITLENLHPVTQRHFWRPEGEIDAPAIAGPGVHTSLYGHKIFVVATREAGRVIFRIEQETHLESLVILRNYADIAIARLEGDRGGRRPSRSMEIWVHNVRRYWEDVLIRKFSLKLGTAFCVAAFKGLDPSREAERRLVTTIRRVLEVYPSQNTRTAKK